MITATSIFKHKLKRVFLRFSFLFPAMISAASLWLASGYTTSTGLVGLAANIHYFSREKLCSFFPPGSISTVNTESIPKNFSGMKLSS